MFHKVRAYNKKHIKNYVEIYIKSDIELLISKKKKFFYKGIHKDIVGKNQKAELPKNPDIVLANYFEVSTNKLAKKLISEIKKKY